MISQLIQLLDKNLKYKEMNTVEDTIYIFKLPLIGFKRFVHIVNQLLKRFIPNMCVAFKIYLFKIKR